jgi:hypothetical protein
MGSPYPIFLYHVSFHHNVQDASYPIDIIEFTIPPHLQLLQQPLRLKQQHNLMHNGPHITDRQIHRQISLRRDFIRIIDAREALDFTTTRLGINPALIRLLAVLKRRRDMNEVKATVLLTYLPGLLSRLLERRNRGRDDSRAGTRQFRGDEGDTRDVFVAVFAGEAQLGREFAAHGFAEEEGDGAAALLVEGDVEGARDGVFAAVVVAR